MPDRVREAAAPERCPECGVDLKEGDLFTGACELCSAPSPVVDRDGLDADAALALLDEEARNG